MATRVPTPRDFKQRPTVNGTGVALQGEAAQNLVVLGTDQVNANATANTLQDVAGLSFAVNANQLYRFSFLIVFDAAATGTGARFTLNGPAKDLLAYHVRVPLTSTGGSSSYQNAYNSGAPAASSAFLNGNLAEISGVVRPTVAGTIQLRFASEIGSSAITVKAGSTAEWW